MTYIELRNTLTYFVKLEQQMNERGYKNIAAHAHKQMKKTAVRMASAYWNEEGLV